MATFIPTGAWQAVKRRGRYPVVEEARRTAENIVFGSRAEMMRGIELMTLQRAGKIEGLSFHPVFEVVFHMQHFCRYTADSMYRDLETGNLVVEEVKSKATRRDPSYRLRRKAAEIYHNMLVTEIVR